MSDILRETLIQIVARFGVEVSDDPKRCEALLRDLCGGHKREIAVLVAAIREGVTADLKQPQPGIPQSALIERSAQQLHENLGVVQDLARWCVESWALAITSNGEVPDTFLHQNKSYSEKPIPKQSWRIGKSIRLASILLFISIFYLLWHFAGGNSLTGKSQSGYTSSYRSQNLDSAGYKRNSTTSFDSPATVDLSLFEIAKAFWDSRDYNAVIRTCDLILNTDPGNERAIHIRASAHARSSNWALATEDYFRLKMRGSQLSRQRSQTIWTSLIETAKIRMSQGYSEMDSGNPAKAKLLFDAAISIYESADMVSPSKYDSTSFRDRAKTWSRRCELALLDTSGQIAGILKIRKWKDASGKHSLVARFIEVSTKAKLECEDGRQIEVELSRLSYDDRVWIENFRRLAISISGNLP